MILFYFLDMEMLITAYSHCFVHLYLELLAKKSEQTPNQKYFLYVCAVNMNDTSN